LIKDDSQSSAGSNFYGGKCQPKNDKIVECFGEFIEEYKWQVDLYFRTFKKNQREYQLEMESMVKNRDRAKHKQFIMHEEEQ
jgi:hypothetical protein